jgi:2-polyprenyl-3-methyl-5-hydroxy-6-metoxy-1,4-benzoquinol methylase
MHISGRSYQKELLDQDGIPSDAIERNMAELNIINTFLGGHQITLSGFKKLLGHKKDINICEIGCGGGDNLLAIYNWSIKKNIRLTQRGIDINPDCIAVAKKKFRNLPASFLVSDYRLADLKNDKPEIIFSSLFCHHFTDEEIISMLQWMRSNSTLGFFINDLHRHRFAYYSIRMITRLFSRSYLVKHDAPLSVLRGFTKKEWKVLLQRAGIISYQIEWRWAFRWLIIFQKKEQSFDRYQHI